MQAEEAWVYLGTQAAVNTAAHVFGFRFSLLSRGLHNQRRNFGAVPKTAVKIAATAKKTLIRVNTSCRDQLVCDWLKVAGC